MKVKKGIPIAATVLHSSDNTMAIQIAVWESEQGFIKKVLLIVSLKRI